VEAAIILGLWSSVRRLIPDSEAAHSLAAHAPNGMA